MVGFLLPTSDHSAFPPGLGCLLRSAAFKCHSQTFWRLLVGHYTVLSLSQLAGALKKRRLAEDGLVEVSQLVLSIQSLEVQRDELVESKVQLEAILWHPVASLD